MGPLLEIAGRAFRNSQEAMNHGIPDLSPTNTTSAEDGLRPLGRAPTGLPSPDVEPAEEKEACQRLTRALFRMRRNQNDAFRWRDRESGLLVVIHTLVDTGR